MKSDVSDAAIDAVWAGNLRWLSALLHHAGIEAKHRVLDVGCGNGRFSRLVARASGCTIVGTEVDPTAAAEAGGAIECWHRPAGDLPAELGMFDVIFCRDVLPRVRDVYAFLLGIRRSLRPGGRFFTVTPDPDDIGETPLSWAVPELADRERQLKPATQAVCNVLRRVGFENIRNERLFLGLLPIDYLYVARHSRPGFSALHSTLEMQKAKTTILRLEYAVGQLQSAGATLHYSWERTMVVAQ